MFSTFKQRLLLGVYVFLILSIPIGAYLVSQFQSVKSSASEPHRPRPLNTETPPPIATSSAQNYQILQQTLSANTPTSPTPSPDTTSSSSTTVPTSYGPTLSFKVALEGRPTDNQSGKMFVGIMDGATPASNPKFMLNFTVDLNPDGHYDGISLAGLNPGNQYTAILKGPAQIATASAFIMSPTVSRLNSGDPINLLTGDLNDDNVINSSDYTIEQKALGSTSTSPSWNDNLDFNKDHTINLFDLAYIISNFGKTGATGAWYSPIPKAATSSASLNPPPIGGTSGQNGYWIWVPK